jgi:hypothetical protein
LEVSFDYSTVEMRTVVTAKRQEYDAPLLRPVEVFAAPYIQNHDRMYVAAALLFHREISGQLDLGESIACSRHVALQIERFFSPLDVTVRNQTFTPHAIPAGRYISALGFAVDDVHQTVECNKSGGEILLRFVPEAVGSLYSEHEIAVGTNLLHGRGSLDASVNDVVRHLGASVLLCEEFQIAGLRLPFGWRDPSAINLLEKVGALLSAVSLTLDWQKSEGWARVDAG